MRVVSLDDPTHALPPGETGEIAIRGPNVTAGYWNRAEETAQAFADGFFLTGDVGYMAADGQFYLVDRKKDMILSGGFNVYPRIIEDAIYEHPDELTLDALRGFLADRIGRHELPTALEIRPSLPKTAVGKMSRRDLSHPPSQEI
jgi:long-chain acyl-CoA synthetase